MPKEGDDLTKWEKHTQEQMPQGQVILDGKTAASTGTKEGTDKGD